MPGPVLVYEVPEGTDTVTAPPLVLTSSTVPPNCVPLMLYAPAA